MSFLSIDSAAELLVREWQKLYERSPRVTVAVTFVLAVAVGTAAYFAEQRSAAQREAKRLQTLSYSVQAQKLEETRSNLQALLQFVEEERRNLQTSEQALRSLKQEHEQLKPLVDSDRKTIDALFSAQEVRNQSAQRTERWIGFAMGVASSLVASLIWAMVAYVRGRRRGQTAA